MKISKIFLSLTVLCLVIMLVGISRQWSEWLSAPLIVFSLFFAAALEDEREAK